MKLTKEDIISPIPEGIVDGKMYSRECIDSCKLIKLSKLREVVNFMKEDAFELFNDTNECKFIRAWIDDLFGEVLK